MGFHPVVFLYLVLLKSEDDFRATLGDQLGYCHARVKKEPSVCTG